MARIRRLLITGEPTAYHVISRTALEGFPLQDVEKDFFFDLVKRYSSLYFVKILGFCFMGNHFHLLVRMLPDSDFSDKQVKNRYKEFWSGQRDLGKDQIPYFREKFSSLSEFIREIKLGFSRYYNKRYDRRGYFWGDRFKSVIVENGQTLINCLAYIDLNPVRAGLVERPEDYRWSSIGYHVQTANKDGFLSLDFGLKEFGKMTAKERLRKYRRYLYETGAVDKGQGARIDKKIVTSERKTDFHLARVRRFKYRTRYFTDSGIIGTKAFIIDTYNRVKENLEYKKDKIPKPISGLEGMYSLKRLAENTV